MRGTMPDNTDNTFHHLRSVVRTDAAYAAPQRNAAVKPGHLRCGDPVPAFEVMQEATPFMRLLSPFMMLYLGPDSSTP